MQGKLQEFYAFLSTYRVKIKRISAVKLQVGLSFYVHFVVCAYVRKGETL